MVTSTKLRDVYKKQNRIEKYPAQSGSCLARDILNGDSLNKYSKLPAQIKHGKSFENEARKEYKKMMMRTHKKCNIAPSGLVINKQRPFLAASPDDIRTCKCCRTVAVEYKCPFTSPFTSLEYKCPFTKLQISHPLAKLINQLFVQGIVPSKLKVAKVISLFKQGDSEITSSYRPISMLPIFSKLYEKGMHKRLYAFITSNNIIHPLQFGFQENHSVDDALISITEAIRSTLDNKKYGCAIFVDLQKAFDSLNHNILLSKLEHYGIRGDVLLWFASYLSDKYQYLSVNERVSKRMKTAYGVPQGSVLGPLLFPLH